MKMLLFPLVSVIAFLPLSNQFTASTKLVALNSAGTVKENTVLNLQDEPEYGKMSSVVFKRQDYCRAELKDFEFDAKFLVVGATVYFSGANFASIEQGTITSSSLKPIKHLMDRCKPGSLVVFDNVKVKGPDELVRTIPGITLKLF